MKKALTVFLFVCTCLLPVVFLSSCSDSKDTLTDTTTETVTTEKTCETSGFYSDTVKWKYDEASRTFSFSGTGKIDKGGQPADNHGDYWTASTEIIRIEEGITDIDNNDFTAFEFAKILYLPSGYNGSVPELKNIEKYVVAENNPKYSSDKNGVLFNHDQTEIIRYPKGNPSEVYEIPDGVTQIRQGAFDESKYLKTVIVPKSLDSIPRTIFEKSAVYSNPANWEDDVFYAGDCLVEVDWETDAEHIIVKEGTRIIEAHAFSGCENVRSITVPDSVEIIGAQAFENCSSLETIYIGSGVKEIGVAPFVFDVEGLPCRSLKSIEVSKDNKHYTSVDGVLFNKEMTELIQYPIGKKQKEYVIPDSVTKLGYGAFCYCDELTKLTVGKGITVIDYCLVFGCDNIETVVLPNTLTTLDEGAFKYSGIKFIDIPDSVTYLGCEAMTACNRLETVNIGKGVSFIHERAIGGSSLEEVKVDSENRYFTSEKGVLFNKNKTELLLYPANKNGKEYHIPASVTTIKNGAIMQAKNFQKIYVGSGVGKIEECNFYESVEDHEFEYRNETNYEIYYDGTKRQWNKLFVSEYEREYIDESKINFLK